MEKLNIKEFVDRESKIVGDRIRELVSLNNSIPKKIVFIRVGEDPASISYMKSKSKQLKEAGLDVQDLILEDKGSMANWIKLKSTIESLNKDNSVLGMLIQSPVPGLYQYDYKNLIDGIDFEKDLDAFGGRSVEAQYKSSNTKDEIDIESYPCTPLGILYYLDKNNYSLAGKKVAIIGRSDIVGKPLSLAMIKTGAIVTVYNSNMKIDDINKELCTHGYNVIISAIGRPELIEIQRHFKRTREIDKLDYVFDVGINRVEDIDSEKGYKLVGDIAYVKHPFDIYTDGLINTKFKYTPVPGGVGLLTRLGLLLRAERLIRLAIPGDMLD